MSWSIYLYFSPDGASVLSTSPRPLTTMICWRICSTVFGSFEAEAMQQHAVAMARQAKAVATTYEQELEKMKKRTL